MKTGHLENDPTSRREAVPASNLTAVLDRLRAALGGWFGGPPQTDPGDLEQLRLLCSKALRQQGEVSAMVLVAQVVDAFEAMTAAERLGFFLMLARDFSVEQAVVEQAIGAFQNAEGARVAEITALKTALESPRLRLFRLFNTISGGNKFLIDLRAELLSQLAHEPELMGVEYDLRQLLGAWFNIGFLKLKRITWESPAAVLEKLIRYEAVHRIEGWEALKHRLTSARTVFAFFHPAMPGEPLIFVEAAIVEGLADNIQALITPDLPAVAPEAADTAIFYSISNAQKGLRGIPLGNFLIKQVLAKLRTEIPHLSTFATLSPIPNFRRAFLEPELARSELARFFQKGEAAALRKLSGERDIHLALAAALEGAEWAEDEAMAQALRPGLLRAARYYLVEVRKEGNVAACSVAHFHASNGALLGRINWLGDSSPKGLRQSLGMMVNYVYDPKQFEKAQAAYVQKGDLTMSREVQNL